MTRREEFEFGDYVVVEQKRYGVPNEFYVHKVIGMPESNSYIDVPAQTGEGEKLHDTCEPVVSVICCGVYESKVVRYRAADCRMHQAAQPAQHTQVAKEDIAAAWCAGYYHAGYTNDGAYAVKMAYEFAAEWGAQPVQVPDGWTLVPVEPTEAMYEAGYNVLREIHAGPFGGSPSIGHAGNVFKAMLSAAPSTKEPK